MSIGSRIKECRERIGMTQEELADIMGVSKGTIGNYETDVSYPRFEHMSKLFDVLQTDANYIFQDVLPPPLDKNDMLAPKQKKSAPLDKDRFLKMIEDFSDDELYELLLFLNFLRWKRDHSEGG